MASRSRAGPSSRTEIVSEAAVAGSLKDFYDGFKLSKEEDDEISLSDDVLEPVKNILRAHGSRTRDDKSFQSHVVSSIISELDDDVCSRLQIPVYNAFLRLLLQTRDCKDIERGLYLLTATLYRDSYSSSSPLPVQQVEIMKAEIGKDSLQPLLEFFVDTGHPMELRRWAGILLRQLFQGSDKSLEILELGPERTRRSLGNMLSTETNDCLVIICGQVIKELVEADIDFPRKNLWPTGTSEEVYNRFPDSSQPGRWNQRFQAYLDNSTSQQFDTNVYFAQNVATQPPTHLERPGHTTNLITDSETMTIWSPASGAVFDQFLDIPLQDISAMAINTTAESQIPNGEARVDIFLVNDEDKLCHLNATGVALDQVAMVMLTTGAKKLKEDLSNSYPELDMRENFLTSQEPDSQISLHSGVCDTPVTFHEGGACTLETTISTSKVVQENGKKVQDAANTDNLEEYQESGESVKRSVSRRERSLNSDTPNPQPTSTKRGATGSKSEAQKLPMLREKVSNANGKEHSASTKPVAADNVETTHKAKAATEPSNHSEHSAQTFEQKVEKLTQLFSTHDHAVLRGVLVVAKGNLDLATEELLTGGQTNTGPNGAGGSERGTEEIEFFNKADEQFHSASFTSPDRNDASTPKLNKPLAGNGKADSQISAAKAGTTIQKANQGPARVNSKPQSKPQGKPAKYSLKPKPPLILSKLTKPLTKSEENSKPIGNSKSAEKANRAKKSKSTRNRKAPESSLYDIEATDDENVTKAAAPSNKGKRVVAKIGANAAAKETPAMTKKSGKLAKGAAKKRQSAPAALQTTAAATRSRRGAAKEASQEKDDACLSGDDVDGAEDFVEAKEVKNTRKVKSKTRRNALQPAFKAIQHDAKAIPAPSPEIFKDSLDLQQVEIVDQGPLDDGHESEVNATQKPPGKKKNKQISPTAIRNDSKRDSQRAELFSSKLQDMLGDIDDSMSSESKKYLQQNSKSNNISDATETDPYKESKIHQKHKVSNPTINDAPPSMTNDKAPAQKLVDASFNEAGPGGSALDKDEAKDDVAAETADVPKERGLSNGHDSFAAAEAVLIEGSASNSKQKQEGTVPAHELVANKHFSDYPETSPPRAPHDAEKKALPDVDGKRKAVDEPDTSIKRRRNEGNATQANSNASTRQSQRLKTRTEEESHSLHDVLANHPLVDDRVTRKVPFINFGASGPMNQGPSSILRSSAMKNRNAESIKPPQSPVGKNMKRTREDLNETNAGTQIPGRPKKRQNISPEQNQTNLQMSDENHLNYSNSPPVLQHRPRRSSRPSSQGSRVAPNGSPRALVSAEKVDHFSKVRQKLLQNGQQQAEEGEKEQALHSSQIFAPKPRLANIPKTGPSSPQNIEARYVKHQKIGNDRYEGVETNEVVIPEKPADPFVGGPARGSSGFTERLQAGALKENRQPEALHQQKKRYSSSTQGVDQAASDAVHKYIKPATQQRNDRLPQKTIRVPIYDEQITLVNSETELPTSPSDMASGSTIEGGASPLSENSNNAWNLALRPHYAKLSLVTQRLTNEVYIRLAKEEDVMGLLVTQFQENGSRLLVIMTEKRNQEKAQIVADLEKQKEEMLSVYSEAKTLVDDCEKKLKSSTLPQFEKQWRRKQQDIQRIIDEGRKLCE